MTRLRDSREAVRGRVVERARMRQDTAPSLKPSVARANAIYLYSPILPRTFYGQTSSIAFVVISSSNNEQRRYKIYKAVSSTPFFFSPPFWQSEKF